MTLGPFFDPFKGRGTLLRRTPFKAIWGLFDDDGDMVASCQQFFADPIVEDNKRAFNDSAGTRWGDGKVVSSVPLDIYFRDLAPAAQNGDEKYIKRYLNDSDNRAWRKRGGVL